MLAWPRGKFLTILHQDCLFSGQAGLSASIGGGNPGTEPGKAITNFLFDNQHFGSIWAINTTDYRHIEEEKERMGWDDYHDG